MGNKAIEKTSQKSNGVAGVLRLGLDDYREAHGKLSPKQWKVANRILDCHTPALGSSIYNCDSCGDEMLIHHSCRDRHCPSCQHAARAQWVEDRTEELLPVGYFHVVFTVPSELNRLALRNKRQFYDILFEAVSRTLLTLGTDRRWLGGSVGFIAVLHTWGQNLLDHPHVHCIVPGGGVRADGKRWKAFRDNYLFPVKVMSLLYRRVFLEALAGALEANTFSFPGKIAYLANRGAQHKLLAQLKSTHWCVYAKEPFATPEHVIRYLGKYTHRVAISNSRILNTDHEHTWFKWKDYKQNNQSKVMQLTNVEFIRRFMLHILPHKYVRIRYYGFLSNRNRKTNIKRCRELLARKRGHKLQTVRKNQKTAGPKQRLCPRCAQEYKDRRKQYSTLVKGRYRESTSFNMRSMKLLQSVPEFKFG